jgi:hypothetical protein
MQNFDSAASVCNRRWRQSRIDSNGDPGLEDCQSLVATRTGPFDHDQGSGTPRSRDETSLAINAIMSVDAQLPNHSRDLNLTDNWRGLVAWVYQGRLPSLACTLPIVFSGRPRCGFGQPLSASRGWETVSGLRDPCGGMMRHPFQHQVLGSQAAVCPTPGCSAVENHR